MGSHRNISESEFLELYKILREKIKKIPIIIISDQRGCFFAKKISKKNKLELIFCKDISKSIYSDFFIIIKSNLFFCFKAGGMLVIPWFSKKNFIWGGTIVLKINFPQEDPLVLINYISGRQTNNIGLILGFGLLKIKSKKLISKNLVCDFNFI